MFSEGGRDDDLKNNYNSENRQEHLSVISGQKPEVRMSEEGSTEKFMMGKSGVRGIANKGDSGEDDEEEDMTASLKSFSSSSRSS